MPLVWSYVQPLGRGLTFRNHNRQGRKCSPASSDLDRGGIHACSQQIEARRTGYWLVTAATIRCTMPSIAAP